MPLPRRSSLTCALCHTHADAGTQYVCVSLRCDVPLSFGGSEAPAAHGELVSIGGIGGAVNASISAAVSAVLQAKLSVPPSRFYLKFQDVAGSDMGWDGATF